MDEAGPSRCRTPTGRSTTSRRSGRRSTTERSRASACRRKRPSGAADLDPGPGRRWREGARLAGAVGPEGAGKGPRSWRGARPRRPPRGSPVGEDEGCDDGMVADAVKPLSPRRPRGHADASLTWTRSSRQAAGSPARRRHRTPRGRGPRTTSSSRYQHPDGHVAGTLAQLAVMEDERPDGVAQSHSGTPSRARSPRSRSAPRCRSRSPSSGLLSRSTDGGRSCDL